MIRLLKVALGLLTLAFQQTTFATVYDCPNVQVAGNSDAFFLYSDCYLDFIGTGPQIPAMFAAGSNIGITVGPADADGFNPPPSYSVNVGTYDVGAPDSTLENMGSGYSGNCVNDMDPTLPATAALFNVNADDVFCARISSGAASATGGSLWIRATFNGTTFLSPLIVTNAAPSDADGDGVPDSEDDFPNDASETTDSDGDGVGDNGDQCANTPSSETADSAGCGPSQRDSDGDGANDDQDAFPNDPTETADSDNDGVGDNADAFPNDPTRSALPAMPVPLMPAIVLFLLAGLLGLLGVRRLKL